MTPVAILVCLSLLFLILQQMSPALAARPAVFLGFNIAFLLLVLSPSAMTWLGVFIAAGYLFALAGRKRRGLRMLYFILPVVFLFTVLKKYEILPLASIYSGIPEIVGLSYVVFRTISVIVESCDTGVAPPLISYLNYCVSMFTLLSGPIQRFHDFCKDEKERRASRLTDEEASAALTRVFNGFLKIVYLAPWMQDLQSFFLEARDRAPVAVVRNLLSAVLYSPLEFTGNLASPLGFFLAALFYLVFLYFNFSGYTDVVLGLGRLVGFRLPENFDRPFSATNFLDFWRRWHISLSLWFRDYCFTPIMKVSLKAGLKGAVLATLPAYFISFGLLGIWHGRTWPFIICGLMFAIGSSFNQFWRTMLVRLEGKQAVEKMNEGRVYQSLSAACTLFYIALAITGLWLPGNEYATVWHSFSNAQAFASSVLVWTVLTCFIYCLRCLAAKPTVQNRVIFPVCRFFACASPGIIGLKAFLILVWFFSFSTALPDFVYKGF